MTLSFLCLLATVPVPEEHQDLPGGVRRDVRHEEERAVRGLRPFRRQGLWKGKAASLFGHAEREVGDDSLHRTLAVFTSCPQRPNLNHAGRVQKLRG